MIIFIIEEEESGESDQENDPPSQLVSGTNQSVSGTSLLQDSLIEEEHEISQPLVFNTLPIQDLSTNTEYLEREETVTVQRFLSDAYGCDLASGSSCSTLFTAESLESYRRECSELT